GLNMHNLHAEVIDGNNPLAVIDAMRRKRDIIENGDGPVLLDVIAYRQSGHSPSDASAYREREEIDLWRAVDTISEYARELIRAGIATQEDLARDGKEAEERVARAVRLAVDLERSPRISSDAIARVMFSHEEEETYPGLREGDIITPPEQNSRVRALAQK